jgi:hypothetical protein
MSKRLPVAAPPDVPATSSTVPTDGGVLFIWHGVTESMSPAELEGPVLVETLPAPKLNQHTSLRLPFVILHSPNVLCWD